MYKVHGIMKVEEGEVAMMKKPKYSYGYAALMGILTVIICMAVADGLIGIRGTVQNYVDLGNGYHICNTKSVCRFLRLHNFLRKCFGCK